MISDNSNETVAIEVVGVLLLPGRNTCTTLNDCTNLLVDIDSLHGLQTTFHLTRLAQQERRSAAIPS